MGLFEEAYDQYDRIRSLVREFDSDGSGEIEFSEFNLMVAKAKDILKAKLLAEQSRIVEDECIAIETREALNLSSASGELVAMARVFYRYFPSYDPMAGGSDAGNCILVTKDWISNTAGHSYNAGGGAGVARASFAPGLGGGSGAGRRSSVNTNFDAFAITAQVDGGGGAKQPRDGGAGAGGSGPRFNMGQAINNSLTQMQINVMNADRGRDDSDSDDDGDSRYSPTAAS